MARQAKQPKSLNSDAPFHMAKHQALKAANINDPLNWVRIALPGVQLWSKQHEILTSLNEHHRVAVRSCHDSGKSFIASVAAARWLDVHPAGSARVITTAPTAMQVKGILWVEINMLKQAYDLPGRTNQTEWWIGSYLAGVGRKPSDYNPAAFSGLHARYPLIIIDEASGVTPGMIDAVETLATNINARILMIGNPDDPSSTFAKIHEDPQKYGYHTIRISAWDTPNFTDEGQDPDFPDVLREVLLSPEWVEQRRKAWGEQHPFWLSKVEAEFPPIDTMSVIKLTDIVKARVPYSERPTPTGTNPTGTNGADTTHNATQNNIIALGVDVAGSDQGDETILRLVMPGNIPTIEWALRSSDPVLVADFIVSAIIQARPNKVVIDSIGVGFGIIGSVRSHPAIAEQPPMLRPSIIGFNASQSANDKQYGNARAKLWWGTRMLFQAGKIDTSQADNQMELEAQLLQPRYHIDKGKIYIEAKEDIKKRIGRSPDNADAFLYALHATMASTTLEIAPQPRNTILATRHNHAAMGIGASANRLVSRR